MGYRCQWKRRENKQWRYGEEINLSFHAGSNKSTQCTEELHNELQGRGRDTMRQNNINVGVCFDYDPKTADAWDACSRHFSFGKSKRFD